MNHIINDGDSINGQVISKITTIGDLLKAIFLKEKKADEGKDNAAKNEPSEDDCVVHTAEHKTK